MIRQIEVDETRAGWAAAAASALAALKAGSGVGAVMVLRRFGERPMTRRAIPDLGALALELADQLDAWMATGDPRPLAEAREMLALHA